MLKPVQHGPGLHYGDCYLAEAFDGTNFVPSPVLDGRRFAAHTENGKRVVAGTGLDACACNRLEIDWLPFAAEAYHVSADINDYVLTEVPIVVEMYPNRNFDAFPYGELTTFRPLIGAPAYRTFRGKPVHQDHDNADPTKAKGVIFDATMVPFRGRWHVKILKGFDRSKDRKLAEMVERGERMGHSMGALVERTECSLPWCRFESDGITTCEHIRGGAGKGEIARNNFLIYELLKDFNFVESSSVGDPASVTALSTFTW